MQMDSVVVPCFPTGTDQRGSLISHEMANHECRVSDIQNEPAKYTPTHVLFVENPRLALLAEIARKGRTVVFTVGQIQANGQQSRDDIVDFNGQRL
ncbi:hypothetical protein C7402_103297 [Paraburkholderia unamae]|uniref:Uncharacterized protein n=1 Tax=Paraburkholderia unamae TaxID=219649 RepID=A0ABX5KSG7_9BURK|nr:hypothetical protein C7402_103297 [Paraburkholderia unamae]